MTHIPQPVSKIEFARRAGRGRSRITEACADGGALAPALLPNGRLDARHEAAVEWARARGIDPSVLLDAMPATPVNGDAPTPLPGIHDPANADAVLDMTVRDFTERFGGVQGFADWIDNRKTIAEVRKLELGNAEKDGALIQRDYVRKHMIGALDTSARLILQDAPPRMAIVAGSGATREELERHMRDALGSMLARARDAIVAAIEASGTELDDASVHVSHGASMALAWMADEIDEATYERALAALLPDDAPRMEHPAAERRRRRRRDGKRLDEMMANAQRESVAKIMATFEKP